jgi:hypothetical protein
MTIEWSATKEGIEKFAERYLELAKRWKARELVEAFSVVTKLRVKDARAKQAYGFRNVDVPEVDFIEGLEIWVLGPKEDYDDLVGVEVVEWQRIRSVEHVAER